MAVLNFLLIVAFFLHVVPVNLVIGGMLIAGACLWLGRFDTSSYLFRLGNLLRRLLPIFLSIAIVEGLVLFVMLRSLFGLVYDVFPSHFAAGWIMFVPVCLLALAQFVWLYRWIKSSGLCSLNSLTPAALIILGVVLAPLAFWISDSMTILLYQDGWLALSARLLSSLSLACVNGALLAQFTHVLLSCLAVTGLAISCLGIYYQNADPDFGTWAIKCGALVYTLLTFVQLPVGGIYYTTMPREMVLRISGQDGACASVFFLALIAMIVSVGAAMRASNTGGKSALQIALTGGMLTVFGMLVSRHQYRTFLLEPYLNVASDLPVLMLVGLFSSALALSAVYLAFCLKLLDRALRVNNDACQTRQRP